MTWYRKILGLPEPGDELNKGKEPEPEKTLEEWKKRAENKALNLRGSKVNESPYVTYFFKYCIYCHEFRPEHCFDKKGSIYGDYVLDCSKLRVNMKKLDERK